MLSHVRRALRRGVSLVELLMVLVILGVVGMVVMRVVVRQQRFYAGAAELMTTRGSMRELSAVLPTDLRAISSSGGDIYAMSDSMIDFRQIIGSSVACQIPLATGMVIILPPLTLGSRSAVTTWLAPPAVGDSVLVYDEGATAGVSDDSWRRYRITALTTSGSACPTTTGFTRTTAEVNGGMKLTLSGALLATVVQGAPIRFFRRAQYRFYRNMAGEYFLGYVHCPGGTCTTVQPLSGPFMPYVAGGGGVEFTYIDSTGAATANPLQVARINVVVRSKTRVPVAVSGDSREFVIDSLAFETALRNRQ